MHNKPQNPQSDIRHEEIFNLLISIFAPNSVIEEKDNKEGTHKIKEVTNGIYTVVSKTSRYECLVKEGKRVLFEEELFEDGYSICTRGMYLKHLDFSKEQLTQVDGTLSYHPSWNMKHSFFVTKENAKEILTKFKNINMSINNGLVKPGEIENSSKPHLK